MKIKSIILLFLLCAMFLNIVSAQPYAVLHELKSKKKHIISENTTLLYMKNTVDKNTYVKLSFVNTEHIQPFAKGVNEICLELLFGENSAFRDSLKKYSCEIKTDENSVYIKNSNIPLDTLFKQLSYFFYKSEFKENKLQQIISKKNSELFPPKISPNLYIKRKNLNLLFGDENPSGQNYSKNDIGRLRADDCKKYYQNYLRYSNKYLMFIGNTDNDSVYSIISKYFKTDEKTSQTISETIKEKEELKHTTVYFYETESGLTGDKTYMNILYRTENEPYSKDKVEIDILNNVAGKYQTGRLSQCITEYKNDVSYISGNISTGLNENYYSGTIILKPDITAEVLERVIEEKRNIIENKIYETEVEAAKNDLISDFNKKIVDFETQFKYLYAIEKQKLPEDYFSDYYERINDVKLKNIKKAAKKYLKTDKYSIVIFGKKKYNSNEFYQISDKAEINIFDKNILVEKIEYGFGADDIIKLYLEAVNADFNPKNQTIISKGLYDFGHTKDSVIYTIYRKNKKFASVFELKKESESLFLLKKNIFDGKNALSYYNGESHLLNKTNTDYAKTQSFQFPELEYYKDDKIQKKLLGIFNLKGKEVFKIKVSYPYDYYRYDYYDKTTRLKVLEEVIDTDGDVEKTVIPEDYKEVGNSKRLIPFRKTVTEKNYKAVFIVDFANFNKKVKSKVFEIDLYR